MAEFRMPSLGADMESGTVTRWLVQPGDTVHRGDIVAVIETEKADVEVEVFQDGIVQTLLVSEGAHVDVGTPLAIIEPETPAGDHDTDGAPTPARRPPRAPAPAPSRSPSPVVRRRAAELGVDLESVTGTGPAGRITRADVEQAGAPTPALGARATGQRLSPRARRLAAERGVEATTLAGTGPRGAVIGADVEREGAAPVPKVEPATPPPGPVGKIDKAAGMRAAIARAMARSKREIPHYYLSTEIDFAPARRFLDAHNEAVEVAARLLPAAVLLKATALAVRETPELNGFWIDDRFQPSDAIHMGVAIAVRTGGLVAPAIHDADQRSLPELMTMLRDLVARARSGSLRASEMSDPTITVTNLGEQGVDSVLGVIYPPQVALVGFGAITERPWAVDGLLGIHPVVTATLAADHRASDGARGARLLRAIDHLVQRPEDL